MKTTLIGLLLICIGTFGCQTFNSANRKFIDTQNLTAAWRTGDEDHFMAMRSNAHHWWAYFKRYSNQYFPQELLKDGLVIGDSHVLNFGTVIYKDRYYLAPVDLDDAGQASMLSDVLRLIATERTRPLGLDAKAILDQYQKGLNNEPLRFPNWIQEILDLSADQVQKSKSKRIKKFVNEIEKIEHQELRSKAIAEWNQNTKDLWQTLAPQLLKSFPDLNIQDIGFAQRTTGGIKNMIRYLILVSDKAGYRLLEVKQISEPSIGYWSEQADLENRYAKINSALKISPVMTTLKSTDGKLFILRERQPQPIEKYLEDHEPDRLVQQQWSKAVAYKLGQIHRSDALLNGYKDAFNLNFSELERSVNTYVTNYLEDVGLDSQKP